MSKGHNQKYHVACFEKTFLRRVQKSEIDIKHGTVRLDGETKREYRSTER